MVRTPRINGPCAGAVAENVRELRAKKHWSQRELAGRLGWSQPMVSRLERGESATVDQVCQVAGVFGVTPARLLREAKADG